MTLRQMITYKVKTMTTLDNQPNNHGVIMKNNELEQLLSVPKVMEHFGISRSTLYHLTKTELPYVKVRNRKFFRPDDINNLIKKNYHTP